MLDTIKPAAKTLQICKNFPVSNVNTLTRFLWLCLQHILNISPAGNMTVDDIIALSDMFVLRPQQACRYHQLRRSAQKVSTKMLPLSSLSLFQTFWRPCWPIIRRSLKDPWKSQKSQIKDKKNWKLWLAMTTTNWQSLFGKKMWRRPPGGWPWKPKPPGEKPWRTRPPGWWPWKTKPPGGEPWQ